MRGGGSGRGRPRAKLGFIGAGNMATALVRGLLAAKVYRPADLLATDALPQQRARFRRGYGIAGCPDNAALVRAVDTVVLAVKPQVLPSVLDEVRVEATRAKLFVSIAAGFPIERLRRGLGDAPRIVRVMPNTPALVGRGMSVLVAAPRTPSADLRTAMRIFRAVGDAMSVEDEALLDPVTGLSGSGPAYVYRFAEALIAAGVEAGLAAGVSARLVYRTLDGACAMLKETRMSPQALRDMVTSPGGTTFAGLEALERAGFRSAVTAAVAAATARARELGRQ